MGTTSAARGDRAQRRLCERRSRQSRHAEDNDAVNRLGQIQSQRLVEHAHHQREIGPQPARGEGQIDVPGVIVGGQQEDARGVERRVVELNRTEAFRRERRDDTAGADQSICDRHSEAVTSVQQHVRAVHWGDPVQPAEPFFHISVAAGSRTRHSLGDGGPR